MGDINYWARKQEMLNSPDVSGWLKEAIRDLDQHDPVDAVNEARILLNLMTLRAQHLLTRKWPCLETR